MEAPSSLATFLFTAGAIIPFSVVVVCTIIGLVKR
jgi:hypothetical protein